MDKLKETLRIGFTWIWESEHPEGALISHHGISSEKTFMAGRVRAEIVPQGYQEAMVVVFELIHKKYSKTLKLLNPLTRDEVNLLRETVVEAGGSDVVDEWNGVGYSTVSYALAKPSGAGVVKLVEEYQKGCPIKGDDHQTGSVFCKCGWYGRGVSLVSFPEGWR